MKSVKIHALAAALAATTMLASVAHAGIFGDSSDTSLLRVGESNINSPGGTHTAGLPGFAVIGTGLGAFIDFQGLVPFAPPDANGVSALQFATGQPDDHSNIGVFHFSKVSNANLYFGEWSQTGNVADGTHTVYYVGDDGGSTTVPSSGFATYSVKGVSDYANNGILTGTFFASFAGTGGTLAGSISNSGSGYGVNIGSATISGAAFSGAGASATQSGVTVASGGDVSGRFFGANAAALAGIVEFSNRQYDTAFGGSKN